MRVRHLLERPKVQRTDSGWRSDDMPPRACPIFAKGRPSRAGWQWRSVKAEADGEEYYLVALANTRRGDWKSMLIRKGTAGASVVARFEYHSSHPGQHLHSDCARSGIEIGAVGLDNLARFPDAKSRHRRTAALTASTFWQEARRIFRIHDDLGPLYSTLQ